MSAIELQGPHDGANGVPVIGRGLRRLKRIPRAGRWCFLIAFINAAIWTVIVPPFQVPDELAHFAYAQYVAEHGHPPALTNVGTYSPQEVTALDAIGFFGVIGDATQRGVLSPQQEAVFKSEMRHAGSSINPGGTTSISPQPPLYYYLAAVPYWISPWHGILARLAVMRLLSALLAACTVLIIFMLLRELMPAHPWAWTVGALMVAFEPVVNFLASAVQADNLLFCVSALTLYLLVRGYRRGWSVGTSVLLGLAVAAGLLTKLTFVGLVPGFAIGVLILGLRARRRAGTASAVRLVVLCALCAVIPVIAYLLADDLLWHRGASYFVGALNAPTTSTGKPIVIGWNETLDYLWEFYLPKLGFMQHTFLKGYPLVDVWAYGFLGRLGVLDYTFPAWVLDAGYGVLAGIFLAAFAGLWRLRDRVRADAPILLACLVMVFGLLFEIGYQGVRFFEETGYQFEQTRYLFPLLGIYAVVCVLAARAFPRRWAPIVGAGLVLLAMTHGLFAETLTISRYYG